MTITRNKDRAVLEIEAELRHATGGKRYQIDFGQLDMEGRREMLRVLRDLAYDKQLAVRRARQMPWRRG